MSGHEGPTAISADRAVILPGMAVWYVDWVTGAVSRHVATDVVESLEGRLTVVQAAGVQFQPGNCYVSEARALDDVELSLRERLGRAEAALLSLQARRGTLRQSLGWEEGGESCAPF